MRNARFPSRAKTTRPRTRGAWAIGLILGCVLCFSLCASRASAAGTEVAFDAANKLYEESKFIEAAAGYEKLLADGTRSASICYNLGTAYYKAGQMGRAIAAYRQAERLTPRDASLRANLQFVRKRVNGDDKSPLPSWRSWLTLLTLNEGAALAAAAFWVWCLLLAAREFRPAWRPALRNATLATGAATVLLTTTLGVSAYVNLGETPPWSRPGKRSSASAPSTNPRPPSCCRTARKWSCSTARSTGSKSAKAPNAPAGSRATKSKCSPPPLPSR